MKVLRILACDPGSYFGWAYYNGVVHCDMDLNSVLYRGMWDIQPKGTESAGFRYIRLHKYLDTMMVFGIDYLVYEKVMNHMSTSSAYVYGAIEGKLLEFCAMHDIKIVPIHVGTWKRVIIGKGNARKPDISAYAAKIWKDITVQDEADALCILKYAVEQGNL